MTPSGTFLFSALAILAGFAVQAAIGSSSAAPAGPPGVMIEVQSSQKCIDNSGSRKHGTGLQGWTCSARNLNQRFTLVWQDNRKHAAQIKSTLSSLCLMVREGSPKQGAMIVQGPCTETGVPVWQIVASPVQDWQQLRAGTNGRCLSLKQIGKRNSALVQAACNRNAKDQRFRFRN